VKILEILLFALLGTATNGEPFKVVLYDNPPLIILGDNEPPQGIVLDFLRSIESEDNGLTFEFENLSFSEAVKKIDTGEADILPGIALTYERQQKMSFSKASILRNRAILFRQAKAPVFEIEDLEGKTVALLNDDVHADAFQNLMEIYGINCTTVEVERYPDAIELLENEEVDVAVINEIFAGRLGEIDSVVSTFISFNPIEVRIGYRPDIEWEKVRLIDEALERQHEDPESPLNRSIFRYLSPAAAFEIPLFLRVIFGIILAVVLIALVFIFILRRLVAQRTKELRIEKDRAEAGDRSKTYFLSNISHEIRTPLNGILGFSQLLESSEDLVAVDRQSVEAIVESSERLETIFESILRFTTLVGEVPALNDESTQIDEVVDEVIEVVSARSGKSPDFFEVDPGKALGKTYIADRGAWYLILECLIDNAVKFGKGSKVKIGLDEEKIPGRKCMLTLTVQNGGENIPEEARERVLLPFEQVDGSPTRAHDGIGLGLSIVQSYVNRLKGEITLHSPAEGGLLVRVRVPMVRARETEPEGDES